MTANDSMLRVEVRDEGTLRFYWPANGGGNGHWGLAMVREFSDRAGITHRPSTAVWCEFDLNGAR